MIEHRGMLNALLETINRFSIGPGDRCLGLTALHHDMSAFDVLGILGSGGTLVIPAADGARDAELWARLIAEHRITVWNSVPAMAEMLIEHMRRTARVSVASLRLAFLGGDWIPLHVPAALTELAEHIQVVSVGGPTETTLWNIWYPIGAVDPSWTSVPYGVPIANNRYHILSAELRDRPDWVTGQLYCAGAGLARGYLADPARTADAFSTHPGTGERLYRTGDLGRYLPGGNIEFVGRADTQVKIRGQRIELGEIEAALAGHPGVAAAVVVAIPHPGRPGYQALAGYVTPAGDVWPEPDRLRSHLRERLPAHMVPVTLRCLHRFPLTTNGKVDRAELVRVAAEHRGSPPASPEAELGALEELLATVWSRTLGSRVGRHDDFFELGGDSLQATKVLNELRDIFEGERIPLRSLFSELTVAGMARALRDAQGDGRLDAIAQVHLDIERLSPEQVEDALSHRLSEVDEAELGGGR
jgi:acyl-coenzyme A synthetase/AMP-(fatty) acid ligase